MASEYDASIVDLLDSTGVLYFVVSADRCVFHAPDHPYDWFPDTVTLTREQMYKFSDEIRTTADGMEFLTCDGGENE